MKEENEFLKKTPFRIKRYYGYVIATIVALGLPFIRIDGNHIFLLSFDKKQLHLLGIAFDMQELYLMPFLLMLLFLGIFAVTSLGGIRSADIGLVGITLTAFEYVPYSPDPLVYRAFTQRAAVVGVRILAGVILFKYTC